MKYLVECANLLDVTVFVYLNDKTGERFECCRWLNVSIQGPKLKAVRIPHGLYTELACLALHCVVIYLCTYSLVALYTCLIA